MLETLGLDEVDPTGESVAILVGPNGSGKSNFLRDIAFQIRKRRNVAVVCNTAYDRFAGMRGIERISASRSSRSPKSVIKRAVGFAIEKPDSRFYQIGRILEYCGYRPRFGFQVEGFGGKSPEVIQPLRPYNSPDFETSVAFLNGHNWDEIVWIDQTETALSFSLGRDFASVLRNEVLLRGEGILKEVQIRLERHDGRVIDLSRASSGELALISSLVFLVTFSRHKPVILVDEPENSLHPSWQREYVDKILNAMAYQNATIVIATHAPLIVTGALVNFSSVLSVFQISEGLPRRIDLASAGESSGGIEEILWRAFDVITPANHFVSEEVLKLVSRFERGEINKETALSQVNAMDAESFDGQQRQFFSAVKELLEKVEGQQIGTSRDG